MARNIVICCDGTGNTFSEMNTNVAKLASVLEQDPATQIVFYDPGLGTIGAPGAWTKVA